MLAGLVLAIGLSLILHHRGRGRAQASEELRKQGIFICFEGQFLKDLNFGDDGYVPFETIKTGPFSSLDIFDTWPFRRAKSVQVFCDEIDVEAWILLEQFPEIRGFDFNCNELNRHDLDYLARFEMLEEVSFLSVNEAIPRETIACLSMRSKISRIALPLCYDQREIETISNQFPKVWDRHDELIFMWDPPGTRGMIFDTFDNSMPPRDVGEFE